MVKKMLLPVVLLLLVGITVFSNDGSDDDWKNLALGQLVTSTSAYRDNVWNERYLVDGDRMGSWPLPSEGRLVGDRHHCQAGILKYM